VKIVLFTYNHVVKEFLTLVADKLEADLDIVEKAKDAQNVAYDYLFTDNKEELIAESKLLIDNSSAMTSVLFHSGENDSEIDDFEYDIKKPFLPQEIEELILNHASKIDNEVSETQTQILNHDDIDEIKALLGDSGLDLATEDSNIEIEEVENPTKKKRKKQKKKNKTRKKSRKKAEKRLLKALFDMDKKEIKEILKDANIILKIEYPNER